MGGRNRVFDRNTAWTGKGKGCPAKDLTRSPSFRIMTQFLLYLMG